MTDEHSIPDFSGDDFANDKEVLAARAAAKAREILIDDSLEKIRKEFDLKEASHINFKGFHMFKSLGAAITYSMKAPYKDAELRVSIAAYTSVFQIGRSSASVTDLYFFGHLTLRENYPSTYIHKETIKEKFEDIFLKRDVDFPQYKEFSRKFQVLTEDKFRLENILQTINLDEFSKFSEMELEFLKNTVLFRSSRKPVSIKEATVFCELAKLLLRSFG